MTHAVHSSRCAALTFFAALTFPLIAHAQSAKISAPTGPQFVINALPKVFYACYIPLSGVVYRIKEVDLKQTCASADHVMFSWTDGGVPGPQGPQGPQGVPGPQGPQGIPGVSGWTQVEAIKGGDLTIDAGQTGHGLAGCSNGGTAIAGGFSITQVANPAALPFLRSVAPYSQPNTWEVVVVNAAPNASQVTFNAVVICAK